MTRYRVLVSDPLAPEGIEILESTGEIEVLVETDLDHEALKRRLREVDGVIVRSGTKLTADLLEGNDRLRVIGRAGIGVDNVDVAAATAIGAVVMNTPGGNAVTTAEHTIGMIFAAARRIPQAHATLKDGKWDRKRFVGMELAGKNLGVVGLGNIGALVAERGRALGMRVLAYDPFVTPQRATQLGVHLAALEDVIAEADVLTLHVPLNEKTRHLIDEAALRRMKSTAILVNCARGGIVDEAALDRAVREGWIAGAAVDVFEQEPPPADHPLLANPGIVVTPHLGASTVEAQLKVAIAIAEQVRDFLLKGEIRNAVNAPSVTREVLERLGPYLTLGEKLGRLVAQLHDGPVARISVRFDGEIAHEDPKPMVARVVKGVMTFAADEAVNDVNAVGLAEARGIDVEVITSPSAEDFASSILVRLEGPEETNQATGAVFGKHDPRIVRINRFLLDALQAEGSLVIVENRDVPGIIGHIGTIFGEEGINIGQMYVGRTGSPGENAMTIVAIDEPADAALLDRLREVPGILSVRQVQL